MFVGTHDIARGASTAFEYVGFGMLPDASGNSSQIKEILTRVEQWLAFIQNRKMAASSRVERICPR